MSDPVGGQSVLPLAQSRKNTEDTQELTFPPETQSQSGKHWKHTQVPKS